MDTHSGERVSIIIDKTGFFLVNDLQTPLPPSKRAYGKIFLAYVPDDFETEKIVKKKKIEFCFVEHFFLTIFFFQNSKICFEHTFQTIFLKNFFFHIYIFFLWAGRFISPHPTPWLRPCGRIHEKTMRTHFLTNVR